MRILQLCHKPPVPASDGGCLAMNNITLGMLAAGHRIRVLTVFTEKHPFRSDLIPADYLKSTSIEGVFVDTRVNIIDAFSSFINRESYNVSRFFSTDFDRRLVRVLEEEEFDVVILESLFMTPYISTLRRQSKASIVLRSHNVEYQIWSRMAKATTNLARKTYLNYLASKLKEYEMEVMEKVDAVVAISADDGRRYGRLGLKKPIAVIPFGIKPEDYPVFKPTKRPLRLFHLGSMDWQPNVEGLVWFLEEIRPLIHKRFPDLEFHAAGRYMPEFLLESKYPGTFISGEVNDAKEFMMKGDIMVVPLLSAGGIRVKIIEGMAFGLPVISTAIGAEGIRYEKNKNIVIATDAEGFLSGLELLLTDEKYKELGQNARQLIEKEYDNRILIERLVSFLKKLKRE
jgi:polysaccharide biosynthesis protein PslH